MNNKIHLFCRIHNRKWAGKQAKKKKNIRQAPVVQTLDSATHRTNHYPEEKN